MSRPLEPLSRRELIKRYGLAAFLIHPVMRSMAWAAPVPFENAPRYIHFFKGGAFVPSKTSPGSLDNLAGTPIAPLQAHAKDIILFKGMSIHGGSPKTTGYKEEHAAGIMGCATGNIYHYSSNDAYFAYTDHESIDVKMANHYKERADLKDIPLASLHIGGGAHSDADNVGVGNRYISFRNRVKGDARYGNAIEPIQDAGAVYDKLMQAAVAACAQQSNQPRAEVAKASALQTGQTSLVDLTLEGINDFKRSRYMDAEHAQKLEGLLENRNQEAKSLRRQAEASKAAAGAPVALKSKAGLCASVQRPTGKGNNKQNLDQLSPVHDQMIAMIKLAFELDLTRVVAFTLSGASSGQVWPSKGVHKAHHSLEHSGDNASLVKIDTYYSEKFADLLVALKSIDDGGGKSALYNSSVLLGMECWSNSSSGHYLTNIPFVFAGQGGGRFKTGQIVNASGRNNNDLHISCLNAAGLQTSTFGLASLCKGPII